MSRASEHSGKDARSATQVAVGALVFAVAIFVGLGLWARFGEAVYLDRIFTAIANCF